MRALLAVLLVASAAAAQKAPGSMIDLADDHYELDITRARKLLAWEPRHSLRDTLPKMVAALKADREKFYCDNKLERCEPQAN